MNTQGIAPIALAAFFLLAPAARAQEPQPSPAAQSQKQNMPGMNSSEIQQETQASQERARSAMDAMSGPMAMSGNMGLHMFMTTLRPENATDEERAAEIVKTVRASIDQYKDYRVALASGYHIFGPKVKQDVYHFTNYWNAAKASFTFDPTRPTSLLYRKENGTYLLVGAMFTAPRRFTESQLNERVPLSVARWHKHVNLCFPPRGSDINEVDWNKFGQKGSIATEQACQAADGRWIPQIFGWMVHVYPYQTDPSKVWAH